MDSINVLMTLHRLGFVSDSLKFLSDNTAISLEATAQNNNNLGSIKELWSNSNFNGGLIIDNSQLITNNPFINGTLNNATLLFDQDVLNIKNISAKSSFTKLRIDGQIKNWRNYILKKDTISADLSLYTDSTNINTLLSIKKQLPKHNDSINLEPPVSVSQDNIIPSNINMKLSLDMENLIYNDLNNNNLKGMLLVTEKSIFLHNFDLSSPMGDMLLNVSWYPEDSLYEGNIDIDISNMNVQKVIQYNPEIVKILPLTETLSGEVNAKVRSEERRVGKEC